MVKTIKKGLRRAAGPIKKAAAKAANKAVQKVRQQISRVPKRRKGFGGTRLGNAASILASSYHPMLGPLAQRAGDWVGTITGLGKYKLSQNTLVGDAGPPTFGGDGSITIRHREYLQNINSSVGFALTSWDINPGLAATFPFLSTIANSFEEYKMLGLVFEFKSTSGFSVGTTNTALGAVIAATEYDVLDPNFSTKQQMEAYEFSTSCAPYSDMCHGVECKPKFNPLGVQYIRSGAPPATGDPRFYDIGRFQLATQGMQAVADIGEVWVSYHVKLMKPKIATPYGAGLLQAHMVEFPASSATSLKPFGTTGGVLRTGSTLPIAPGDGIFFLPYVGRYMICCAAATQGGTPPGSSPVFTRGSNLTLVQEWFDNTSTAAGAFSGVVACQTLIVDVNLPGTGAANQMSVSAGSFASMTQGATDVWIAQLSSGLLAPKNPIDIIEDRIEKLRKRLEDLDPSSIDAMIESPVYVPHPPTPILIPKRR